MNKGSIIKVKVDKTKQEQDIHILRWPGINKSELKHCDSKAYQSNLKMNTEIKN